MNEKQASGRDERTDTGRPEPRRARAAVEPAARHRRRRPHDDARQGARLRWPFALLAYACVALAVLGVVVPGLPTTPFVLAAAWAARRGCPAVDRWLRNHRRLGPLLHGWETQRAIPRGAKIATVVLLALSWGVLAAYSEGAVVPAATGLGFLVVVAFVTTRPVPVPFPAVEPDLVEGGRPPPASRDTA